MKLIRLTTTTQDGKFDNTFNDEIILEPNSKIALQSVALQTDINDLLIDGDNDEVSFEITAGKTRTIELDHGDYNESNNTAFLNQLQLKLNQGLVYTDAQSTPKFKDEIGVQLAVGVNTKGKCKVSVANCKYTYTAADIGLSFKETRASVINFTATNPMKIASITTSGVGRQDDKHSLASVFPFTTGCGVFRVKLSAWNDDGSGSESDTSGFDFGLCDTTPDTWGNPFITKKTYAIKAYQPGDNYFFKTGNNTGTYTDSTVTPDTKSGNNADVLEISIQGDQIVGQAFRQGQTKADPLFSVPYEVDASGVPVPLYGYISFHGTKANIELVDMKFNSDAFKQPFTISHDHHKDHSALGLGARPLAPRNGVATRTLDFKSIEIANFCGFNNLLYSQTGTAVTFIADTLFKAHIENDCFLILLDNLPLDSYDGFKKGRKSILASVPNPQNHDRVVYEPNNLNYIELNNANTISLRNIRATILYQDYTPVETKGFSVINVVVDN